MKLKGIKGIALVGLVALLVMVPVAAAAGGGEIYVGEYNDVEEYNWDARYWWEAPPLTRYEREQVKEIMVEIFDRYFGIDVSAMSPAEFEEVGLSIGREKVLRLFGQYATQRGFEVPAGIRVAREEFILPAAVTYWWELVEPQYREETLADFETIFPGANVRNMTQEEFRFFLNPPLPPLRLWSIEEIMERERVVAVYGRARTYDTIDAEHEWLNQLWQVTDLLFSIGLARAPAPLSYIGLLYRDDVYGYVGIELNVETINQARPLASELYAMISKKAEALGISDVPVVFSLFRLRGIYLVLDLDRDNSITAQPYDVAVPEATASPTPPGFGDRYRPIVGGVMMQGRYGPHVATATTGFTVIRPIRFWWDDIDYVVTGHLGPGTRTPIRMNIYQPRIAPGNQAGTVRAVGRMRGFADVARVAIGNRHVAPDMHIGGGILRPVRGSRDPVRETVHQSGITTGRTVGMARYKVPRLSHPTFGHLYNQILATYRSAPGDSGGPIFIFLTCGGVKIVGIHVGRAGDWAVFSPISGVETELPGWFAHTR